MDKISAERRSNNMRRIKSVDTVIELTVRRYIHSMGYRYRLHVRELPGQPDIVFPRRGQIIQVYGCYWHPHPKCPISHLPKSRQDYWIPKLARNVENDHRSLSSLQKLGWTVLIVRECEIRSSKPWQKKVQKFLQT